MEKLPPSPEHSGGGSESGSTVLHELGVTKPNNLHHDEQQLAKVVSIARLILILSGVWVGVLLVALDTTMLATIAGPVSATFDASNQLSWIITTYGIGAAVSQPLSGHLTDIFGRRAGLVVCYVLFIVGTLFCGLSPYSHSSSGGGLGLFLVGRIFQGLGGGSICSITSFIESDIVPIHKRALIEGIGNVAFGATLAVGGAYGGGISDALGWQWAFLIQIPVVLVNALVVICVVRIPALAVKDKTTTTSTKRHIDVVGCVTIILAITLFQYGINTGSSSTFWGRADVIVTLTLSGISSGVCLYWDTCRSTNPLIPVKCLMNCTIASSQLSFFCNSAATAAVLYYVPIYLQVLGVSARDSGVRFIPYAAAFCFGSSGAGFAVKKLGRYYRVNIVVQMFSVAGTACLCSLMGKRTPGWALYVYLVLLGLGFGGAYVTRLMGLLSAAEQDKQAVVQAASWTISSTGSTVGITAASAIFQELLSKGGRLSDALGGDVQLVDRLQKSFEVLGSLTDAKREQVVGVYLDALRGVFFFALGAILLAALASFCMRDNSLLPADADSTTEGKEK
ncbi:major facilitator superfamily domain-containing protein [Podospora didyma]|uniref:Major facilitator superfamily domain-containing protein n=1 Tax=Podospora didyma TaxID=330526 RepID=A0AAE0NUW3_9PEZI|nr:major facilitator superfamily domain-containing protein [Podospora didyma]